MFKHSKMSKFGKLEDKAKRIIKQAFGGQKDDKAKRIIKHAFGGKDDKAKRILERAFGGQKDDFWGICKHTMSTIDALTKDVIAGGDMLNQRQCFQLSQKLSEITLNIDGLLSQCKESKLSYFKPALESFVQYLEKARVLVEKCGEKNWLAAAVFQSQNENAFREILFDVALCYNAIYEQAQSLSEDWDAQLKDLRFDPSLFLLGDDDIHQDILDLQKKLEAFVHECANEIMLDNSLSLETCKCLASYLLVKMQFSSQQSHGSAIDASSPLLWQKEMEPRETWGDSKYLGAGANEGGVCSTKWLGTPCAKKEFHVQEYESLFLKEAGIMAYLKHPCIINFICCGNGQAKGDRFIAMELMEKSLFDLIQDKKDISFSLPMVVDIIMQIARGMWYLHDLGVAHRDLKPQNVVLNQLTHPHLKDHFCLKLVDFGTSKTKVEASKSNTMTYCGVGTTIYRAPEVHPEAHPKANKGFRGKVNWFQADIFSFAMTCAHLLTLRKPFQDILSPKELFNAVMNGARPSLPNDCPEELVSLLKDCWNTIPCRRPSFLKVCERLEILRQKLWRGYFLPNQISDANQMSLEMSLDFCKTMMDNQSSLQKRFIDGINQAAKVDDNSNDDIIDKVAILPCLCGSALQLLNEAPYKSRSAWCNVCYGIFHGDQYHCAICEFDAHHECVEIEDKVEVFFHHHPLYLLIPHYYSNNLDAICRLCEESVHQTEWVYRCEECDFDIHALCTKYPKEMFKNRIHRHPLTMIQSHPQKIVLSTQCCNGEIRGQGWHYRCINKSCTFHLHLMCSRFVKNPLCIFDHSHRLSRVPRQEIFHCGRCGSLGYSWFYRCKQCNVELHLDCIDDMYEKNDDWSDAYEKFMIEYDMTIDDHSKMEMISKLMDKTLVQTPSKASSSSTSSTLQAMMKVQPSILRPTETDKTILGAIVTENLRKEIAADNEKKKVEKLALLKEARQKLKLHLLEINGNLKKKVQDLQSSKNLSKIDKDILSMRLKKLKEQCCTLECEGNALQGQGQMSHHGPHIVLFFDYQLSPEDRLLPRLLTSLPPSSRMMRYILLCEEPGHEHIAEVASSRILYRKYFESFLKLQPLLGIGLQIVTRAIKALPVEPSTLDCISLPILGKWRFNVHPIDLETYNLQNMKALKDKEDVKSLRMAEDSKGEAFSSFLEDYRVDIFKSFGLRRVRYIVSDESKVPCYTRGMVAWLCSDHINSGLEAGTLASYPSQFYNQGYDIVGEN